MPRCVSIRLLWGALVFELILFSARSWAQGTENSVIWDGGKYLYVVNTMVGADRFYNAGIFGQGTFSANVEAGLVANNEWLNTVKDYYVPTGALNQTSDHATAVGNVLAGYVSTLGLNGYPYYKLGMAPYTYLSSGAIATSYGVDGEFEISPSTLYNAYNHYFTAGWGQSVRYSDGTIEIRSVPTSVINSSWGFDDPTGQDSYTKALDGLARAHPQTTLVVAAGNNTSAETPSNNVGGPASGFNSISVGALGDGTPQGIYSVAPYSSRGPQDFAFPDGTVVNGVRAPVDILAPGTYVVTKIYGDPLVDKTISFDAMSGTSFSSPIVAGGVSLLNTLSYVDGMGPESRDSRVIKAVLMNSATKLAGWSNGQVVDAQGVSVTTQALDWIQGAGMLNLNRAYDQYSAGTRDVAGTGGGSILPLGWDFGRISLSSDPDTVAHNDYPISLTLQATTILDVTLTWFRDEGLPVLTDNSDPNPQTLTTQDLGFANLYLEIWNSDFTHLYAASRAAYNTVQELRFMLPLDGGYAIRVLYNDQLYGTASPEDYGLAWYVEAVEAVPEPGSLAMAGVGCVVVLIWARLKPRGKRGLV